MKVFFLSILRIGSDLKGRRGSNALPTEQGLTLCSDNGYGRFGAAVAILDFNRDGIMDIGKWDRMGGGREGSMIRFTYMYTVQKTLRQKSRPNATADGFY
jgi:hypothetical protein